MKLLKLILLLFIDHILVKIYIIRLNDRNNPIIKIKMNDLNLFKNLE